MRMIFYTVTGIVILLAACASGGTNEANIMNPKQDQDDSDKIVKSEDEWKKILSPERYYILREKGTESPWTGKFNAHSEKGMYICAGCGNELFSSESKFDSYCGWPAFDAAVTDGKIKTQRDSSHGMIRTEIMCGKCGGHLGHVFDDGPTETGIRYCVNSLSLDFKPAK